MSRRIYRNANGKTVTEAVPLTTVERYVKYRRQTAGDLTPAQSRRLRHKANRADARAREHEETR